MPLTEAQRRAMLSALGQKSDYARIQANVGYRNHACIPLGTPICEVWDDLVALGWAEAGRESNGTRFYCVTALGLDQLPLSSSQKANALEPY